MSEVKRYARRLTRTQIELAQPRTEFVLASDYAALEAENENLRLSWGLLRSESNALRQQRDKLAGLLREKFPRVDPDTPIPLNEVDHCCEYVIYQERERLHKVIDAALAEIKP